MSSVTPGSARHIVRSDSSVTGHTLSQRAISTTIARVKDRPLVLITGASGFIGGAIAERLVDRAVVRSLTSHPQKNRFGGRIQSYAYDFERSERMADAFRGVDVFVNSYYVRFHYGRATFEQAVEHT